MTDIPPDVGSLTFLLSRIQFALNISFHILFPTINIALCWFLLFFKVRYSQTQDEIWLRCYRFWVKIFALTFAIGVVTGITMSFQFGTNWPGFMEKVGNIAGPLLGYEVLTAFFLEATFLSVMLFGMGRVSERTHTLATLLVAVGTTLSAFWILALNSWMQTPSGYEWRDGVAFPIDWTAIIFNPSMPYRLTHMLLASGLTAAFFIIGVSAYRLLKQDTKPAPKRALKIASIAAALLIPLQIVLGDLHGLNTLKHQPAKIAAMEAIWQTEQGAPLILFAIIDETNQQNHFSVSIPKLASLILTHDSNGEIKGLNEFELPPPVAPLFYGFRTMVGCGLIMLLVATLNCYYFVYRRQYPSWLLKACFASTFIGWVATLAGWYVTEIGRQPYLVYGMLTTAETVTQLPANKVGLSLTIYALVYAFVLIAYIRTLFVMAHRAIKIENTPLPSAINTQTQLENIS